MAARRKVRVGKSGKASTNSAPAQLAEKNDDRHIRNKIEGVNRSKAEAAETIHHLFMAKLKGYISEEINAEFRIRYKECIRMLNGLEKTLERKIPKREQRWQIGEEPTVFGSNAKMLLQGWPEIVG